MIISIHERCRIKQSFYAISGKWGSKSILFCCTALLPDPHGKRWISRPRSIAAPKRQSATGCLVTTIAYDRVFEATMSTEGNHADGFVTVYRAVQTEALCSPVKGMLLGQLAPTLKRRKRRGCWAMTRPGGSASQTLCPCLPSSGEQTLGDLFSCCVLSSCLTQQLT